jgi:uncharacterized protein
VRIEAIIQTDMIRPESMRHRLEVMLYFRSTDRFLHRASDLQSLHEEEFQGLLDRVQHCHIYLLGKRPRVSLVPGTIEVSDLLLRFEVTYRIRGVAFSHRVAMPRSVFSASEASFEAGSYPHRELISLDDQGEVAAKTLIANFVHLFEEIPAEAKDLEILYVGKGTRDSASDRLRSHSTLQKILGDIGSNDPDSEVFILIYSFEFKKPGIAQPGGQTDLAAERAHLQAVHSFKPTRDQEIALIEGACIAYFRPSRYNAQLLDFPRNSPKSVGETRAGDFFAILVDLDNDPIGGVRTFSDNVNAASHHSIMVDLRELRVITNRERPLV